MTETQFRTSFMQGDKIRLSRWREGNFLEIINIGHKTFHFRDMDGDEGVKGFDKLWVLYMAGDTE